MKKQPMTSTMSMVEKSSSQGMFSEGKTAGIHGINNHKCVAIGSRA